MATTNFWGSRFAFYCNNNHKNYEEVKNESDAKETPQKFLEKTDAYLCPKNFSNEEPGHEKHGFDKYRRGDHPCSNKISFRDIEKIVSKLEKEYEQRFQESLESGNYLEEVNLKGYKFKLGKLSVKIFNHDTINDFIKVAIVDEEKIR